LLLGAEYGLFYYDGIVRVKEKEEKVHMRDADF
jgi:hypothetical protein